MPKFKTTTTTILRGNLALDFFVSTLLRSSRKKFCQWRCKTGQELRTGYTLVSNYSATNASQGSYKLVIEPEGMLLYYKSKIYEPFWSLGLSGLDYEGILSRCFYTSSSPNVKALCTGMELQILFSQTIANSVLEAPSFVGPFAVYKGFLLSITSTREPNAYDPHGFPAASNNTSILASCLQEVD
ncbi:hypothetical protein SUGI_0847580 [Cryptomeria japonica]|nr:hypothetical protein SUGI_0847580 [Cryptomeria japonica]